MRARSDLLRCRIAVAAAFAIAVTSPAWAAERGHGHGAHVHGHAKMNVAVDGAKLEIGLDAPGANIVGFEHAPSTPAEKAAIVAAAEKLRAGGSLFRFPAEAGCKMDAAEVEAPEPAKQDAKAEVHSEFEARYRFTCAHPAALSWVEVGLFKAFPSLEEIDVQALSPRGQTGAELTPKEPVLKF